MNITIDWKFWLALVATVAGVIGPVWLWRYDLNSRDLTVTLSSRSALNPKLPHSPPNLQVSVGGRALVDPYSSVIEISNTGTKPILSSEIEGQITVDLAPPAKLIQAQVVSRDPPSLSPSISMSDERILMAALLLNPGDKITIALFTENGIPAFEPKIRIAGIPVITFRDAAEKSTAPRGRWFGFVSSSLAVAGCFMLIFMRLRPEKTFNLLAVLAATMGTLVASTLGASQLWNEYFPKSALSSVGFAMVLTLSGAVFAMAFQGRRRPP